MPPGRLWRAVLMWRQLYFSATRIVLPDFSIRALNSLSIVSILKFASNPRIEIALRKHLSSYWLKRTASLIKSCGITRAVIHCFSEDPAFATDLMAWSGEIYFSFSGILTYKKSQRVQDTARVLRLDRILVETDAPFLVPQAVRDRFSTNEPAFTRHVMEYLKTLRSEPGEEVEQAVWDNSNRFYRV
jgi:Tat protein secretion system quality control protein TatD with DNase activity